MWICANWLGALRNSGFRKSWSGKRFVFNGQFAPKNLLTYLKRCEQTFQCRLEGVGVLESDDLHSQYALAVVKHCGW